MNFISIQVSVKIGVHLLNNILILFQLGLKSVLYNGLNSSNTSELFFNTIAESDFEHIVLTCTVVANQSLPCSDLTVQSSSCSTTFNLNGILGCDYMCSFTTKKTNYDDVISDIKKLTVCEYLSVEKRKSNECLFSSSKTKH